VDPVGTAPQGIASKDREKKGPVMLFGKHKGTPIKDLPTGYLRWMTEQIDQGTMRVKPWLANAARAAYAERTGRKPPPPIVAPKPAPATKTLFDVDAINSLLMETEF
jgi:hypothetical protein